MKQMKRFIILITVFISTNFAIASDTVTNIVTPVTYFINHVSQLQNIKNNLAKYKSISVVGISGIGKTQVARMFAYENKAKYNLLWFIDCNLDINSEFLKLAKEINKRFGADIDENTTTVKKAVMDYLSSKNDWLLVFDNLKVGCNKKVEDLVKWEHDGNIIFCSQESKMLPYVIEMKAFNKNDSINLVKNILEDDKEIDFLVNTFKGYPILIVQGSQLLNEVQGLSKAEYKRKILQSADKIKLNIELAIKSLKPSAKQLLNKIALINNQSFSKQLLNAITDNQNTLDDDIYALSKFLLISHTDRNEDNPLFEMHDVIAEKVQEINGNKNNQKDLENIITNLDNAIPKNPVQGRIFRGYTTVPEMLKITSQNTEKYNINIYQALRLNMHLIIHYANTIDYDNYKQMINWFNKHDKKNKFKLWMMSNDEKRVYAGYLGIIGSYYGTKYSDWENFIIYYTKAKNILDNVKGFESIKYNVLYNLANANLKLGKIKEVQEYIDITHQMVNNDMLSKSDMSFVHRTQARMFLIQGAYNEALEKINQSIKTLIDNGLNPNDVFLCYAYLDRAIILNFVGKYNEAFTQVQQLYEMNKNKKETHEIFGRIFAQMAASELGLGKIDDALIHIDKAIQILLPDEVRKMKENDKTKGLIKDPELAASYVIKADILLKAGHAIKAIDYYSQALNIYINLYQHNKKNVAQISDLHLKGAKAACSINDKNNYKVFSTLQLEDFGVNAQTKEMINYCRSYGIELYHPFSP